MDYILDDILLSERIHKIEAVDIQCPFMKCDEYEYCPKGYDCPFTIDDKCTFLNDNPFTKTAFYEFVAPKDKPRKYDPYDEVGEAI